MQSNGADLWLHGHVIVDLIELSFFCVAASLVNLIPSNMNHSTKGNNGQDYRTLMYFISVFSIPYLLPHFIVQIQRFFLSAHYMKDPEIVDSRI